MKMKYTEKCKKRFLKRKYNHLNRKNITGFYFELKDKVTFSDKMYEIKFKKRFSLYLYLYLKSQVPLNSFTISSPVEANFSRIAAEAGISKNTVKKAFWELVELGVVIYDESIPLSSNQIKKCLILNDGHFIGYDENNHKIIYAMNALGGD